MPALADPAPFDVRHPGPWTHRTISANGIHVHFAEAGSGPLVVLLHGFGQYWYSWRHQLPALATAGFHAVAVDLRGHGDTDRPPRGYDAFTLSADTSGLIGALGERTAVLVGHGYGGLTAFNTAAIEPSRVRSVVALAAPHPLTLATVRSPIRIDQHGRLMLAATIPSGLERRLVRNQGALLERWFRSHAGDAWKATDDFSGSVGRMRRAITIPGAAHASCEMLAWVGRSPWRADGRRHREALTTPIAAPVVQVGGRLDSFVAVQRFAGTEQHCIGGYRQMVIPDVGHYAAEEAPHEVNSIIIDAAHSSS